MTFQPLPERHFVRDDLPDRVRAVQGRGRPGQVQAATHRRGGAHVRGMEFKMLY